MSADRSLKPGIPSEALFTSLSTVAFIANNRGCLALSRSTATTQFFITPDSNESTSNSTGLRDSINGNSDRNCVIEISGPAARHSRCPDSCRPECISSPDKSTVVKSSSTGSVAELSASCENAKELPDRFVAIRLSENSLNRASQPLLERLQSRSMLKLSMVVIT